MKLLKAICIVQTQQKFRGPQILSRMWPLTWIYFWSLTFRNTAWNTYNHSLSDGTLSNVKIMLSHFMKSVFGDVSWNRSIIHSKKKMQYKGKNRVDGRSGSGLRREGWDRFARSCVRSRRGCCGLKLHVIRLHSESGQPIGCSGSASTATRTSRTLVFVRSFLPKRCQWDLCTGCQEWQVMRAARQKWRVFELLGTVASDSCMVRRKDNNSTGTTVPKSRP